MNIEELQEKLLEEQEARKNSDLNYQNLKKEFDELKSTNEKLVDYNNKLFMRIEEPIKESPKEKSPEELENEEIKAIREIMAERRF